MDLEEWEFLSDADDGYLDLNEDGGQKIAPKTILNMNHFICPSAPTTPTKHSTLPKNQFLHVPIHLDLSKGGKNSPDDDILKEIDVVEKMIKAPNIEGLEELKMIKAPSLEEVKMTKAAEGLEETDQDAVSQVFFKKMKENEFVDMKMDSPKSGNRGILPPMDAGSLRFDDEEDESDTKNEKKDMESDTVKEGDGSWEEEEEENNGGLNIWKWSLTGIGALSSIGVAAAATICILILGGHQRSKQHQSNQKLRFQIYTDDQDYSYLERGVLPYVVRVRVPSALFGMIHNTLGDIGTQTQSEPLRVNQYAIHKRRRSTIRG